ncbi:MAG: hypothetical protein WHT06_16075 [Desulfobacterales bacterium]
MARENLEGTAVRPCLWMQAGVVPRKDCRLSYRCAGCPFDRALRRVAEENRKSRLKGERPCGRRGAIEAWQDRLRRLPARLRPCVHHLAGRIPFRACTADYLCRRCEFDQYFAEEFRVETVPVAVAELAVEGLRIPQGFYLHPAHVWLEPGEGGEVRLGLDDFAWRLLSPEQIAAPRAGERLERGRPAFRARRGNREIPFPSPVDGVVTAVNPAVRERSGKGEADPYDADWVLTAQAAGLPAALGRLEVGEAAARHLAADCRRLSSFLAERGGLLAADGGLLDWRVAPSVVEALWEDLGGLFFPPRPEKKRARLAADPFRMRRCGNSPTGSSSG